MHDINIHKSESGMSKTCHEQVPVTMLMLTLLSSIPVHNVLVGSVA